MAQPQISSPESIVAFWQEAGAQRWFRPDSAFDAACREGFEALWAQATAGELDGWQDMPEGALALVLLLDQMPRNMFRGTARAYASDAQARDIAARAVERGFAARVPAELRRFFHLPFSHAEDLADQDRAVALAEAGGDAEVAKWARHHRDIVARFGRFPHRNAVLGRDSTPDELSWLTQEGAFKG